MKKIVRLNENDIEKLVKKIIKEESVNPEWFQDLSEPSKVDAWLFDKFSKLKPDEVYLEEHGLTYYLNPSEKGGEFPTGTVYMVIKEPNTFRTMMNISKVTLYLDPTSISFRLYALDDNDSNLDSSVKRVFKEVFGKDVDTVEYYIPSSYLHGYSDLFK